MEMVSFNCPHCGDVLEAPAHMNGQTHLCPTCNGPVQLQVVSTKAMVTTGIVVGTLSVLGALFGLGD